MTDFFALLLFGLAWQPPTLPDVRLEDLRVFPSRDFITEQHSRAVTYRNLVGLCASFHGPNLRQFADTFAHTSWLYADLRQPQRRKPG